MIGQCSKRPWSRGVAGDRRVLECIYLPWHPSSFQPQRLIFTPTTSNLLHFRQPNLSFKEYSLLHPIVNHARYLHHRRRRRSSFVLFLRGAS